MSERTKREVPELRIVTEWALFHTEKTRPRCDLDVTISLTFIPDKILLHAVRRTSLFYTLGQAGYDVVNTFGVYVLTFGKTGILATGC
jgi:hypothetical protein